MGLFWALCKRTRVHPVVFGFYSTLAIVSIGMGLFGAWAFQAIYDAAAGNEVGRGLTFMGGLVFGAVTFVLGTFLVARPNVRREFWNILGLAIPCLAIALAFGRMGCFFAHCCFGITTTSRWGLTMPGHREARVPTNLFEAIFSFVIFIVTTALILLGKKDGANVFIFGIGYSVWRFAIEFVRGDGVRNPGDAALTPSQIQSIILVVVTIALLILVYAFKIVPFRLGKELSIEGRSFDKNDELEKTNETGVSIIADENNKVATTEANTDSDDFYATNAKEDTDKDEGFYTKEEIKKSKKDDSRHQGFESFIRKVFFGAVGIGAILFIIGLALIAGDDNQVATSFLMTYGGLLLAVGVAFMPLPRKDYFPNINKGHQFYNAGKSHIGRLFTR